MNFDTTFCPYFETCKEGHDCRRAYTEEVKNRARITNNYVWTFMEKPDCYRKIGDNDKE